jgi:hypothetical protein
MLSHDAVVRLNQELAGTKVLSVYLNAEETDPAARRAWRVRLDSMLRDLTGRLKDAPDEEREAARAASALIRQELERYGGLLPGRGWLGFATPDRLRFAEPTPVPMPNVVRWEDGAHMTPYLRALKQWRPVTAAVVDSRRARIVRYLHGELNEEEVLHADSTPGGSSAGSSNRASTHSGVRGETREDAVRRSGEVSTQRMIREVAGLLSEAANDGHLLLMAGNPETTAGLLRALPEPARERAMEMPGIHAETSSAELKRAIEAAASTLSANLQRALVEEVIEATRSAGRACLGREQTERALRAGAVDTLILSRSFARAEPSAAERLVDLAFEQGASVEEISDAAAGELDREGGIGARLRFAA